MPQCQEPWVLGHKCSEGKAYCIEFVSENETEEEENDEMQVEANSGYGTIDEEKPLPKGGNIAVLTGGVPRYHTLIFKGVVQGKRVTILVD